MLPPFLPILHAAYWTAACRHIIADYLRRCWHPSLCGPVLTEMGRHVWGQMLSHPPTPLSRARLGVWECVKRYHTSSRTCEDREGNPAGGGVSWSNLSNTAVPMGGKLKLLYFNGFYYSNVVHNLKLELSLVLASWNKGCPADVATWTMCQFTFFKWR